MPRRIRTADHRAGWLSHYFTFLFFCFLFFLFFLGFGASFAFVMEFSILTSHTLPPQFSHFQASDTANGNRGIYLFTVIITTLIPIVAPEGANQHQQHELH
jgi:hypothetical protein